MRDGCTPSVLQFYFVRELLAAELLFGLGFAGLFVLGGLAYSVGSVAERELKFADADVRVAGDSTRRSFSNSTKSLESYSAAARLVREIPLGPEACDARDRGPIGNFGTLPHSVVRGSTQH